MGETNTASVLIIGAGPAGLTAGYTLIKHDIKPLILEADPQYVGGIARTVQKEGNRFDIGGHRFFSKNPDIEALWREILNDEFIEVPRLSRIYYRGKFYAYPVKAFDALWKLGLWRASKVLVSYLAVRAHPIRQVRSFEDWVVNQFGRELFEAFFKTYTEKVWGVTTQELSADWAAQRIKGLDLRETIINGLFPRRGQTQIKTLIDHFRYPRLGPGEMWETCRDKIIAAGGKVRMGERVVRLQHDGAGIMEVQTQTVTGETVSYPAQQVLSTMPLRELVEALDPAAPSKVQCAAHALGYRDHITVALIVNRDHLFPDNWIYIHDPGVKVGRIQNFGNWSRQMVAHPDTSVLGMEYFCFEGDGLWNSSDEALVTQAARELTQLKLANPADIGQGYVVRSQKAYPVYDDAYVSNVQTIRDYLAKLGNLQVAGRNGMHKYNNQDHSMLTAIFGARNLMGEHWDAWKVNSDAEYHEETRADDTGGRMLPQHMEGEARRTKDEGVITPNA